jgi:hypothetical protein
MRGAKRPNIMGFAVIIPGNNLDKARTHVQNLQPTVIPEQIAREDPVLAVWDFGAKVGEEPRRNSWKSWMLARLASIRDWGQIISLRAI